MQGGAQHSVSYYKYWGCSAPLSKIFGVLKHLQHPPSYAPVKDGRVLKKLILKHDTTLMNLLHPYREQLADQWLDKQQN